MTNCTTHVHHLSHTPSSPTTSTFCFDHIDLTSTAPTFLFDHTHFPLRLDRPSTSTTPTSRQQLHPQSHSTDIADVFRGFKGGHKYNFFRITKSRICVAGGVFFSPHSPHSLQRSADLSPGPLMFSGGSGGSQIQLLQNIKESYLYSWRYVLLTPLTPLFHLQSTKMPPDAHRLSVVCRQLSGDTMHLLQEIADTTYIMAKWWLLPLFTPRSPLHHLGDILWAALPILATTSEYYTLRSCCCCSYLPSLDSCLVAKSFRHVKHPVTDFAIIPNVQRKSCLISPPPRYTLPPFRLCP